MRHLICMAAHNLQDTIALLAHTPAALDGLLRDLPPAWTERNEGENTMTVVGVVGHLIHADLTNWLPRARTLLEHGEKQVFPAFDRMGHERAIQGKTLPELLDEFTRVRQKNLAQLRAMKLSPQDLERRGRHPSFGPVTLSQLLATWAAHDLTHLHQITRVMVHQYRETVGPFRKFLGVLQCEGHSAAA